MTGIKKRFSLLMLIFIFACLHLQAENPQVENLQAESRHYSAKQLISFDFVNQQLREILFAFSTYSQISIIGDNTVTGTASFQYNGAAFEQAFDSFLMANRLFAEKNPDVWIVSRVKISVNENGMIIIDSLDA